MNRHELEKIARSKYPAVRRVLGEEYQLSNDREIEQILAEVFEGASPEEVENFMRTMQKFGRSAAPIVQRALPGVISGATTGMALGPWGALAGAVAGGAASLLTSGGSRPRPQPQTTRPPVPRPAPALPAPRPTPTPPVSRPAPTPPVSRPASTPAVQQRPLVTTAVPGRPAAPGSNSALAQYAAQLLALLAQPQTQQALLSLVMGASGRRTTRVAGRQVPAAAFANAIAEISAELANESANVFENLSAEHLTDAAGNARCDVANPAECARILLTDVLLGNQQEATDMEPAAFYGNDAILEDEDDVDDFDTLDDDLDDIDEFHDVLDAYESAAGVDSYANH